MDKKDENEHYAQDRIDLALDGLSTLSLSQIYRDLISVLRSKKHLRRSVRSALADAIERGQTDEPGMRLKIEANGDHFRNNRTYKSNRELLNAGHFIRTEKANGLSYVTIYALLPNKFGIVDGSDYGKRARSIYSDFMKFLESDDAYVSDIRTIFDINDDDFLAACQQRYAENISLSPIPWDDLETGPKK